LAEIKLLAAFFAGAVLERCRCSKVVRTFNGTQDSVDMLGRLANAHKAYVYFFYPTTLKGGRGMGF